MVLGQAVDVMLQGVEGTGGKDAGLAHPAAQQFAVPAALVDQLPRAGQGRADRRAQPLAETDAHGIEVLRPAGGAVQMGPQSVLPGPAADGLDVLVWQDLSAAAVVGVFQADQPGADQVGVVGADQPLDLLQPHHAVPALDRPGGDSAELGVAALLVVEDVAARLADQLVAGPAVQPHADQVRHGAGGHI